MNINFDQSGGKPQGVIARIVTIVVGAIALGAAMMFSLVFFAVLAVVVLVFGGYFWWKTRAIRAQIRKQMQEQAQAQANGQGPDFATPASQPVHQGDIIEGEAVRVPEDKDKLPYQ